METTANSRRLEPLVVSEAEVTVVAPFVGVIKSPSAACVEPNFTLSDAEERFGVTGQVPVWHRWSPVICITVATVPVAGLFEAMRGNTLKPAQVLVFESAVRVSTILPV